MSASSGITATSTSLPVAVSPDSLILVPPGVVAEAAAVAGLGRQAVIALLEGLDPADEAGMVAWCADPANAGKTLADFAATWSGPLAGRGLAEAAALFAYAAHQAGAALRKRVSG